MFVGLIVLFILIIGVLFMTTKEKISCPKVILKTVDFFGHKIYINVKYSSNFSRAKQNISVYYPTVIEHINRVDSFNCRYVRGYEKQKIISYHGYGQAIDINPQQFPSIRLKDKQGNIINAKYPLPKWFTDVIFCMNLAGFRCGAHWHRIYDPMHFEIGSRAV